MWAGQVEIHVKASEWYQHGHQNDDAYGNVILHVVYENDEEIYDKNGVIIPCLELKGMIQFEAQEQYIQFLSHSDRIACKSRILSVPALKVIAWTERMMVERLEFKSAQYLHLVSQLKYDWELAFYFVLCGGFGYKVNVQPMQHLALAVPLSELRKLDGDLFTTEALFFGQSGMLNSARADEYTRALQIEYRYLQNKLDIPSLPAYKWKFSRMRPGSFPSISHLCDSATRNSD